MEQTLSKFAEVVNGSYEQVNKWKKDNKKRVIGCFPMYVPEEIIHAAGMLPITLLGSDKTISLAGKYLFSYLCDLSKENFDLALKGDLDFLDGIVFPDTCDVVRFLPDIWHLHKSLPFHHTLVIAGKTNSPSSRKYIKARIDGFRLATEDFIGHKITDQDLKQSIEIYNRNRTLLNRLYQIRRTNPTLFKAKDIVTVVNASMLMPKEEHNSWLEELVSQAEKAGKPTNNKVKLILSGSLCEPLKGEFCDLVEEMDATVVDDDLYVGSRYFTTLVNETLPPIEALADRFIRDIPYPTKFYNPNEWTAYLVNMARHTEAKGIVILMLRYCEVHGFDYPFLKRGLSEAGIPHLLIETEQTLALQQIRTRLQAFIETITD